MWIDEYMGESANDVRWTQIGVQNTIERDFVWLDR